MHTEAILYKDEEILLEGMVASPDKNQIYPVVIFCHSWNGRDDFIDQKAKLVTELGFVGFALDIYGKGRLGKTKEENAALKKPFLENRFLLARRLQKALEVISLQPYVDKSRIAVVGFGFGGLCALDFARLYNHLKGVVCIYGHFESPQDLSHQCIHSKVLIIHGYDDPIVPIKDLFAFQQELNKAKVNWQTIIYGHCMHAFTRTNVNDPTYGVVYNPLASKRAWKDTKNFLQEILV